MSYIPGKRANEMPMRNSALAKDFLEKHSSGEYKYSMVDLMIKYKVSYGRIYQLLKKAGAKRK